MLLRKSRNIRPLRYYLYISGTKVDMLFDQIDQSILKRISAEVKVDLKVASLTLREEDNPVPSLAAKLRIVERFIDLHHNVGTMSEPGQEYFRGKTLMNTACLVNDLPSDKSHSHTDGPGPGYTGDYSDGYYYSDGHRIAPPASPPVGFISTKSRGIDAVILVGSQFHLISEGQSLEFSGASSSFRIARVLTDMFDRFERDDAGSANGERPEQPEILGVVWRHLSHDLRKDPYSPRQRLDFLAVPLAEYESKGHDQLHVVLGTPLYVAMAR